MSVLAALIRSYQSLEALDVVTTDLPASIAQGLTEKSWKLIDIVRELGEVLISEIDATRSRGVGLLAAVVGAADKAALDRQSTKTLVTFFTDKLSDTHSLISCITALTTLTECPNFGSGEGMEVTKGLFASVVLSSYPQSTRFLVYTLIDALMSRSRPALKRLGKTFIKGYCALAEGEKDPRNLMMSFTILRVVLVEFDITDCVEDLFDITFCYFPITFTPPADDPYGITSEDLVVALRNCLASTPRFGTLALPLFLDKMQAASEKAKRQTLQALTACFPVYGAAVCGEWSGRFSEALSIEVFHASDDETLETALTTFQSLFATLYPDFSPAPIPAEGSSEMIVEPIRLTGIEGIGIKVVANSLDELREPEKSNAKPAARILAALQLSSNRMAHYILSKTLTQLLILYKDPDEVSLRAPVLVSISLLLAALAPAASTNIAFIPATLSHLNAESPLEPFRDDLLSIFASASRSAFSRPPAMQALVDLIKIPGFLLASEVAYCVGAINDVLNKPESEEEYSTALDGLVIVSKLDPGIIESATLPLLFAQLPKTAPLSCSKESIDYRRALESLASLCLHSDLFEILAQELLVKLEFVCGSTFENSKEQSRNGLYAHHILATLRAVLKMKIASGDVDVGKYVEFLPKLFTIFLLPTLDVMDKGEVAKDKRLLLDVSQVITSILQRVEVDRQSLFSSALNQAFYSGNLSPLLGEQSLKSKGELIFAPLLAISSTYQQDLIVLFAAALIAMRPKVEVEATELNRLLSTLLERSLFAQNDVQLQASHHLLGSVVNKRTTDIEEFLTTELPIFWEKYIVNKAESESIRKAALQTWAWIAKGLIPRSDARGYDSVLKIIELFNDPILAVEAAASLGNIVDESDRVLSKENFSTIRLLYKQRFFTFLLPKLVAGHKESSENHAIYLVALSYLLQHIPRQMSLTELPKLLPLLVTALDLPDAALRANVIETLGILAREVPTEMNGSVDGIVTKLLKGITSQESTNTIGAVKLRLASLQYLSVLPANIEYSILHPQKLIVLKALGKAVDDPRREVRRAAVDCRSQWYLYGK